MIYPDTITLHITGGDRTVRGVATFLDSSKLLTDGAELINSRFRFVLSPAGAPIPATGVRVSWRQFTNLIVEGAIEPHYRRGRLHHYECVARAI